ncbi:MAG: hypothetical protein ACHQ1G_05485 [Planctomycetota bacterium]
MRPVYVRELKELSPALALALICVVLAGVNSTGPLSVQLDEILAVAAAGAIVLGLVQGVFDRWRRADLFALHRPVSAARMEVARTLAGATAVLLAIVALGVAHRLATLSELARVARMRGMGISTAGRMYDHLGVAEIAFLAGVLLAAWAVVRFAVGAARARWAVPALIVLPFAAWALLSHAATLAAATVLASLLAALFSLGSGLSIAGDRR